MTDLSCFEYSGKDGHEAVTDTVVAAGSPICIWTPSCS
jgi:hypothetical protein